MHERLGLPRKATLAEAERAAAKGLHISETRGSLRKYLDHMHFIYRSGADYRVTPSGIYVINEGVVVTVLPIPKNLRTKIMAAWKAKHETVDAA